jgi:hypothetical protein
MLAYSAVPYEPRENCPIRGGGVFGDKLLIDTVGREAVVTYTRYVVWGKPRAVVIDKEYRDDLFPLDSIDLQVARSSWKCDNRVTRS